MINIYILLFFTVPIPLPIAPHFVPQPSDIPIFLISPSTASNIKISCSSETSFTSHSSFQSIFCLSYFSPCPCSALLLCITNYGLGFSLLRSKFCFTPLSCPSRPHMLMSCGTTRKAEVVTFILVW